MTEHHDQELHRDFYRLEGKVGALEERIAFLNAELSGMRSDMKYIMETLSEARGGWRTLMMVGGLASAITAAMFKLIELIGGTK